MMMKRYGSLLLVTLALLLWIPQLGWCPPPGPPGGGPGGGGGGPGGGPPNRGPVPEPATALLVGAGALGTYVYRKFKKNPAD